MMERDSRQKALVYILNLAEKQGTIILDDIINCAGTYSLPIQDVDWLSSEIAIRGIIVYDEAPLFHIIKENEEELYHEHDNNEYEDIYNRIIELDYLLKPFISEVKNIRPLQKGEFSHLKYQVKEGNQHARNRLIEIYLRRTLKKALQRAETYDMDIQDAIGDACVGLVMGINASRDVGSYASSYTRSCISSMQLSQKMQMHFPVNVRNAYFLAYRILKSEGYLGDIDALEYRDMYYILKDRLSFSNKRTQEVLCATIPFESFENLYSGFLENTDNYDEQDVIWPIELIAEDDTEKKAISDLMSEQVLEVLETLSEREKQVLIIRYGLEDGREHTLEEVGFTFDVSRERVRQIEKKALQKLRQPSRIKKLTGE